MGDLLQRLSHIVIDKYTTIEESEENAFSLCIGITLFTTDSHTSEFFKDQIIVVGISFRSTKTESKHIEENRHIEDSKHIEGL